MDLLNKNGCSESIQKEQNSALRVTNATSVFRSTGRDTEANWANRIKKDVNDLTYNVRFTQIKGKGQSPHQFRMKSKLGKRDSKTKNEAKQFDKHLFRLELMQTNKASNPEKYHISEQDKYSTLETQGLCKFQFDKTIAGWIKNRGHRHLDFRNQTTRQMFMASQQVRSAKSEQKSDNFRNRIFGLKGPRSFKLSNCHDFESYSPRRVFEPRQQLDKIYDTDHYFIVSRARRTKETAKMSGLTGRKQEKPKESATLSYEEYESRKFVMRPVKSHQVSRSPRRIQFGKQVISPERGCFR